jgi:hypothetical protein
MVELIRGRIVVDGPIGGELVVSRVPLSLWGGIDPATGTIIDRRHDRCGISVIGKVLAFPEEKGSSTASAVLVELIRNEHAPAGIVTRKLAPIVALGAIVAAELYGRSVPILLLEPAEFERLRDGARVRTTADGDLHMESG